MVERPVEPRTRSPSRETRQAAGVGTATNDKDPGMKGIRRAGAGSPRAQFRVIDAYNAGSIRW